MSTRVVTASATGPAMIAGAYLVEQLKKGLDGEAPAFVMTFASTEQPLGQVASILDEVSPAVVVLSIGAQAT